VSDQEKQHHPDEPVVDIGEDINVTTILTVGVVTALIVTVVVIVLVGLFHQAESVYSTEINADLADVKLIDLKREQIGGLGSYDWVDRETGAVSIPIEQAVELTIAELNADRVAEPEPPVAVEVEGDDEVGVQVEEDEGHV